MPIPPFMQWSHKNDCTSLPDGFRISQKRMVPEAGFEPACPFERHPLKMVCLPSSTTPARNSPDEKSGVGPRTACRLFRTRWLSVRRRRRRRFGCGNRFLHARAAAIREAIHHRSSRVSRIENGKPQRSQHEDDSTGRRCFSQKSRGSSGPEGSLAARSTERGRKISRFSGLQEDDQNHDQGNEDVNDQKNCIHSERFPKSERFQQRNRHQGWRRRPALRRYSAEPSGWIYCPA